MSLEWVLFMLALGVALTTLLMSLFIISRKVEAVQITLAERIAQVEELIAEALEELRRLRNA